MPDSMSDNMPVQRAGYVAIVGRPNVGKSTLLNRLVGQKLAITSSKPQTTRHRLLGIRTEDGVQAVFVDTPGIHPGRGRALNRYLNRTATGALEGVDLVLMVVQGTHWTAEDARVLELVKASGRPAVAVINKIDLVPDKAQLLAQMERLGAAGCFAEIVPVSARKGSNVDSLAQVVGRRLPPGEALFPEDQVTDRSLSFMAAELVREKLMRHLRDELPYVCTVAVESFVEQPEQTEISAIIWVERPSHKGIVIGKGGAMLKQVGTEARADLEKLLETHVFLQLVVREKSGWTDDDVALRTLGYQAE
ncbi:GTPase Era [Immundisolibacter sp.]|uniref:GTPase Era n=1 Tax=Immundisolibacter sp. TaxID=1934948 RepID=UPI0035647654